MQELLNGQRCLLIAGRITNGQRDFASRQWISSNVTAHTGFLARDIQTFGLLKRIAYNGAVGLKLGTRPSGLGMHTA